MLKHGKPPKSTSGGVGEALGMHLGRPGPWAGLGKGISLKISRAPCHTPIANLKIESDVEFEASCSQAHNAVKRQNANLPQIQRLASFKANEAPITHSI
jgi:hypothetical protein